MGQSFNSIVVRLKGPLNNSSPRAGRSFNSIVVRLKDVNGEVGVEQCAGFQFHSGSIKSGHDSLSMPGRVAVSIP